MRKRTLWGSAKLVLVAVVIAAGSFTGVYAETSSSSNYDNGAGTVNNNYLNGSDPINTDFAFDTQSNLIPTPIATESNQVVDCVTGKMRYIANIAATTPAGIYTTKVNYIAAPQY